jgi:CSLREA domain-containing protein
MSHHPAVKVAAVAVCLAILLLSLSSKAARAASMTVTTTTDELTTNGQCSLREALRNANTDTAVQPDCTAGSGADTITVPSGAYLLILGGAGNTAGDLDLTDDVTIVGAGPGRTVVDAGGLTPRDRVFDIDGVVATISGASVQHGSVTGDGGGIRNSGTLTLRDVVVAENSAGDDGGGIMNEASGTLTMTRTSIRDNTSVDDAAGVRNDGVLTISRGTVSGNTAADTSGGIENRGTLTLTDSTVENNRANGGDGGGLQNQSGASLTVARSAIVRNTSAEDGGGIDFDVGSASLTNVTVSGNAAAGDGGGLEVSDGATVSLTHVTVAGNTAGQGNGLFNDPSFPATVTLRSTLFANGSSGRNCAGDPITSLGYNLEFPGATCNIGSAPGDILGADPRLGPLETNGGPSPIHLLKPGSPAIDAATNTNCPSTDQWGQPRPVDGNGDRSVICDIGAFEVQQGADQAQVRNEPNADQALVRNEPNDDKERKKETEEQRQQRQHTNAGHRGDVSTEGNVVAVERASDGKSLLLTIGLTRQQTLVVQVICPDATCPDIRVGDYLEADGYQNGVGDPNGWFIAEQVTVLRNGKRVK